MTFKVPEETRVVILQQTDAEDVNMDVNLEQITPHPSTTNDRSVLEEVIERATARHEAQRELDGNASRFPTPLIVSLQRNFTNACN